MYATAQRLWTRVPIPLRRRFVHLVTPTFTVGVTGVVRNERGEILLLRHRFRESQDWELPGGFVGNGESFPDALSREIKEETGLDVAVVGIVAARTEVRGHVDVCYLATVGAQALDLENAEIIEAGFFRADALPPLDPLQMANIEAALASPYVVRP